MYKIMFCLMLGLLVGCHSKQAKTDSLSGTKAGCPENNSASKDIVGVVNIREEYPEKKFVLQEMADVEYIPMETRPEVLLDATALGRICVSDSNIITCNQDGTVFVFDRKGKVRHFFNHMGRGLMSI